MCVVCCSVRIFRSSFILCVLHLKAAAAAAASAADCIVWSRLFLISFRQPNYIISVSSIPARHIFVFIKFVYALFGCMRGAHCCTGVSVRSQIRNGCGIASVCVCACAVWLKTTK